MLGAPQFMRRDGGTQMWRYDGAQCRAFFFLYGPAGAETVRHVETVPAGAASAADPLCLSALKNARKPSLIFHHGRAALTGIQERREEAFLAPARTPGAKPFLAGCALAFSGGSSFVLSLKRQRSRTTQTGHSGLLAMQV